MEKSASPFEDNSHNGDKIEELAPVALCDSIKNLSRWTLTEAHKDARRARDRARYANMTPEQKKAKRGKISEEQKQAKRIYDNNRFSKLSAEQRTSKVEKNKSVRKRQREEEDELCSESIAMENPLFVPDVVFPNGSAQAKSNPKPASDPPDISMIGPTWKPLNIPPVPDQSHNNDGDNSSNKARGGRHQRVTHGERQVLRMRRNEHFHKPKNQLDPSVEENHSLTDDEIVGCQTTEKDENGTKVNDEVVVYENDSEIDDVDIWLERGNNFFNVIFT
ncbi:hypothetical protein EJB05_10121, partial [Eragrostis curvula]